MGQVLIRNLDDAVIEAYREAAASNKRSLEAELRDALAKGQPKVRLTIEELTAATKRLWAATPASAAAVDSLDYLREARSGR